MAKVSSKTIARAPKLSSTRSVPRNFPRASAARPRTASSLPKVKAPSHLRAPSRVHPRSSTPKIVSTRIPKARANTIARASDRASKGLDALNAGFEQNQSASSEITNASQNAKSTKSQQPMLKSITPVLQQITSFGKIFITNTIVGVAVFATYEGMIEHLAPASIIEDTAEEENVDHVNNTAEEENIVHVNNMSINASGNSREDENEINPPQPQLYNNTEESNDAMDRATLPQHFLAGAMGGTAHAILSLGLEVKLNVSNNGLPADADKTINRHTFVANNILSSKPVHLEIPALNYSVPYIFHHSLAHSVLFGSYQLTKRMLLQQCLPHSTTTNSPNNSGNNNNDTTVHIAAIAVAGGLAGQFQHVTSHFSEQWLGLSGDCETTKKNSSSSSLLRRLTLASWPTWRSTMMAWLPSAIGFLAFEYGKLMMDGGDDFAVED